MLVTTDRERQRVLLTGKAFQIELTWTQAALLSVLLNEKSRELMPVVPGKAYRPVCER